ncbi:unnamed protein product, partial [Prorocentrum cordatum]
PFWRRLADARPTLPTRCCDRGHPRRNWPLSCEEKKHRLLALYDQDCRDAERLLKAGGRPPEDAGARAQSQHARTREPARACTTAAPVSAADRCVAASPRPAPATYLQRRRRWSSPPTKPPRPNPKASICP